MTKLTLLTALLLAGALPVPAQDELPAEVAVLKASLGVWDAAIEVWPDGPEGDSIKFEAVETNYGFGDYWISSDFESEFENSTIKVHSIVGYDLDQQKLVGTVIDQGPYAAKMTGTYDKETKTVTWMTHVKDPQGKPVVQRTTVTQKSPTERLLILSVPAKEGEGFTKFMQIKFVKRK